MQAELKLKKKGTEEQQFEELFTEEVQTIKEIKVEEIVLLQIQKDLETKLIQELQEKLQKLEKKIVEEEETKQIQEETEEQKEILHGYNIEFETVYNKDQGVYQVKQLYEQNHGNQTSYEK